MTEAKFEPEELRASLPDWIEEERGIAVALLKVSLIYFHSVDITLVIVLYLVNRKKKYFA